MPHLRDRLALRARATVPAGARSVWLTGALALTALIAAVRSPIPALAAAPLSWSAPATVDYGQALKAISCPSRGLCVAVDGAGHVVASTAPTAGASSWKRVASDASHALNSVSCASVALCAAVDDAGRVLLSTDPSVAESWTARTIDGTTPLMAVSCPSESLCVAVDQLGKALIGEKPVSSTPSSAQPWTSATIDSGHALDSVSCSSVGLCVAVDNAGAALASEHPAGGAPAWAGREVDSAHPLLGVSCYPAGACVALDGYGNAFASADPASPTPTWSTTSIDPSAAGGTGVTAGVSCASSGLCVALDGSEMARASDDPTDPVPAWSVSHAGLALNALSCAPEGFCAAVSTGGRVLSASVPAPSVTTNAPVEVGQTTAKLAGAVNSNDALVSACRVQYGTSSEYGQSVACSALPAPGEAPEQVTASLTGLEPGTLYHYRLVALSGAGEGVGADQTFTTVTAVLVHPRPTITGVPAVGSRLTCDPKVPASEPATLAYEWRRDSSPISGADGSAYRVMRADATHHLQCLVTATNVAGSATGHSAFVTIPPQGVLAAANETAVGRARAAGRRVTVVVRCSPRASRGCTIALRLTIARRDRHGRLAAIVVGSSAARLARGQSRALTVSLDALGRGLLARAKHLTVRLSVSGTVIGVLQASLSRQRLTLGQPSRGRRR